MTTALEELRSEFNSPSNQDIPLESIKDVFNELLDRVASETMNGSSQPQTATATFTTDTNTFTGDHIFDLGQDVAAVLWVTTITARFADGETFGMGSGQIHAISQDSPAGNGPSFGSVDGITYVTLGSAPAELNGFVVNATGWASFVCPRYLKVPVSIVDENGSPYAGANHPTITVRVDVTYL